MLEGAADPDETGSYGSPLSIEEDGIIIDGPALLCEVYEDLKNGTPSAENRSAVSHDHRTGHGGRGAHRRAAMQLQNRVLERRRVSKRIARDDFCRY